MKTPTSHLLAALILPAAMLLCQCATTAGTPPRATTSVTAPSNHWVKVSSRPPTFYPRGVAADCPTDFHNGEWIHAGDAADTRYFIPLRGIASDRRKVLLDEALAARAPNKVRKIACDDAMHASGTCLGVLLLPPLALLAIFESTDTFPGGMGMNNFRPSIGSINCSGHGCAH